MPGIRWSNPQIESLVDQIVRLHKPLPDIEIAGKSRAAINNQRKRLQRAGVLNGAFPGREVKPWTFPELKKLTGLTQEYGFSAAFITQMNLLPGRSKDSISKMMGRHGLGNPAIKERARNARRGRPPPAQHPDRPRVGAGAENRDRQPPPPRHTPELARSPIVRRIPAPAACARQSLHRPYSRAMAALARAQTRRLGIPEAGARRTPRSPAHPCLPILRRAVVRYQRVLPRTNPPFRQGFQRQLLPHLPALPCRTAPPARTRHGHRLSNLLIINNLPHIQIF